jgi:hypothetical protein
MAALATEVQAQSSHALLHGQTDVPPACWELGSLHDQGRLALHFGSTQRKDDAVRAWAANFGRAFMKAHEWVQ